MSKLEMMKQCMENMNVSLNAQEFDNLLKGELDSNSKWLKCKMKTRDHIDVPSTEYQVQYWSLQH